MAEHPIKDLMDITLSKLKDMADANTVMGTPINTNEGTIIIPVSRIQYGFGSGGSDFPSKTAKDMFGGGGGAGMSIQPVAFLVIKKNGDVKMMQLASANNSVDRIINMVPEVVDTVSGFVKKDDKSTKTSFNEEYHDEYYDESEDVKF